MASKHLVGAGLELYINNTLYGITQSFEYTSSTHRKPIYGLDRSNPHELAPNVTMIQGTIRLYRERGSGGLEGAGLLAPIDTISREKYFSIGLIDIASGDLLVFYADRCSVEQQSWSHMAGARVEGTFSFSAVKWDNESQFTTTWTDLTAGDIKPGQ